MLFFKKKKTCHFICCWACQWMKSSSSFLRQVLYVILRHQTGFSYKMKISLQKPQRNFWKIFLKKFFFKKKIFYFLFFFSQKYFFYFFSKNFFRYFFWNLIKKVRLKSNIMNWEGGKLPPNLEVLHRASPVLRRDRLQKNLKKICRKKWKTWINCYESKQRT